MTNIKDILVHARRMIDQTDESVSKNYAALKKVNDSPSVKLIMGRLTDAVSEFAANIAISDQSGNDGFISDGAVLSVKDDFTVEAADNIKASLINVVSLLNDSRFKNNDELAELAKTAADTYSNLASKIDLQIERAKQDGAAIPSIELNPVDAAIIRSLPDNLVAELEGMYNVTPAGSEMKFENGYLTGNFEKQASLPLSMLQTYYRMITVIVARPIVEKPAIFTEELVERIETTAEIIKSSDKLIQFVELKDAAITVDALPPSYGRSIPVTALLEKQSRESGKSWHKSTVSLTMPLEDFKDYINRFNFARAERLALSVLKYDTERTVRDYIMDNLKNNAQVVASGEVTTTAMGTTATARPGVLPLTGIDFTGTQNGTLSEIDLGKILSALDLMESGYQVTHMLVHPQAIATIFYTFKETGLYDKNITSNASIYNPEYGFNGKNPYTYGGQLGNSRHTDPSRNPLLFGYQGAIDPKGVIPRLINGINPATADINMETMLWKRFYVKVGQYNVIILPYAEAPIRSGGSDIRLQLQSSPVLAVNGRCKTDILLLDARRTAIMYTTGQVPHRMIDTNNYKAGIAVCYDEMYSLYMKPYMQAFMIEDVLIESDRSHRVWNVRRA